MKKILSSIFLIAAIFAVQSCSGDFGVTNDDSAFDSNAAERIDQAVADAKAMLVSSPNGWMMHYYTGTAYTGGGYTMFVKFDGQKAHAASDITADVNMVSTSSYDVIKDQGPVLTFNTYNEVLHFLAQPYMSDVDGEQGDYEFIIQNVTENEITLKGKKWGNRAVLTRVAESTDWAAYLQQLRDVEDATASLYLVQSAGQTVDTLFIDRDAHNVRLLSQTATDTKPFYYLPDGIGFRQSFTTAGGATISGLKLDRATSEYKDVNGTVTLKKYEEDGYNMDISDIFGEWEVTYTGVDNRPKTDRMVFEKYDSYIGKQSHTIALGTFHYTGQARAQVGPSSSLEDAAGDYTIFMMYDPATGKFNWAHGSTSEDPTEKFDYLIFYGSTIDSEGYFNFEQIDFNYDKATGNLLVDGGDGGFVYCNLYTDEDGDESLALRFFGVDITQMKRVR